MQRICLFFILLSALILGGCTGPTSLNGEKAAIPSEPTSGTVEEDKAQEENNSGSLAPKRRDYMEIAPMPQWMPAELEKAGASARVDNLTWVWNSLDDIRTYGSRLFRCQFDLHLTFSDGSAEVLRGLSADLLQTDESGQQITMLRYPVLADNGMLYVLADTGIAIYAIEQGGLQLMQQLDFAETMPEDTRPYPAYVQQLDGLGTLLAVGYGNPALPNDHIYICLLGEDLSIACQADKQIGTKLKLQYNLSQRVLLEMTAFPQGNCIKLSNELYIGMADGAPMVLSSGTPFFEHSGEASALRILELPAQSAQPQCSYVVELSQGGVNYCFWSPAIQTAYADVDWERALHSLMGGIYGYDEIVGFYQVEYHPDGPSARINFNETGIIITADMEANTLAVEAVRDASLTEQPAAQLYDTSANGRYQLWKVRMVAEFEGQSSGVILCDTWSGEIFDFGMLHNDMLLGFMDDDSIYVIRFLRGSGLSESYRQDLAIYHMPTRTLTQPELNVQHIQGYLNVRAMGYGDNGELLLLFTANSSAWTMWETQDDISLLLPDGTYVPQDTYGLACFDSSGGLQWIASTGIGAFMGGHFYYAPAMLRKVEDDYWIYSFTNRHNDASYFFNLETMEAQQRITPEYEDKLAKIFPVTSE